MTIVQFSYIGDQVKTYYSLKVTLQRIGGIIDKVFVLIDQKRPFNKEWIDKIQSISNKIVVLNKHWNHKDNLLGHEHMVGWFDFLNENIDFSDESDGIIVKLDPDTAILKDDFLKSFKESDNTITGNFLYSSYYGVGHCYAFKRESIKPVLEGLYKERCKDNCAEDYETFKRILFWKNGISLSTDTSDVLVRDLKYAQKYRGERDLFYLFKPSAIHEKPETLKQLDENARVVCFGKLSQYKESILIENALRYFLKDEEI